MNADKSSFGWRFAFFSRIWDPRTFAMVVLLLFLPFYFALQNLQSEAGLWLLIVALITSIFYPLALFVASGGVSETDYPLYLAWKSREKATFQDWWYWKFRYRVARHMKSVFSGAAGEIFVRIQTIRSVGEKNQTMTPADAPGLGQLIRAFRQKGMEIRFLVDKETRPTQMTEHANAFKDQAVSARTLDEGYLKHLIDAYLSFQGAERELLRTSPEGGVWEWMERYPSRFRFILYLLGALLAIILAILKLPALLSP